MIDSPEVAQRKTLDEKTFNVFKRWLKSHLKHSAVTVIFIKKDGSERAMLCTTNTSLVPKVEESAEPKREKKINKDVMSVYDLEVNGWRSFRWDSIKQVRFEL